MLYFTKKWKKLRLLLSNPDVDVNQGNKIDTTSLNLAIYMGDIEIIELLLAHPNIDVNEFNSTNNLPLYAAMCKNEQIFKMLLAHPNIDVNRWALYIAIILERPYTNRVQMLLAHPNIDVNELDMQGDTPIHKAISTPSSFVLEKIIGSSKYRCE